MKKRILAIAMLLVLCVGLIPSAGAVEYAFTETLLPGVEKAGAIYSKGLIDVCINGKWGYMNADGELEIPCIYNNASSFFYGIAWVRKYVNGAWCWGAIDRTGETVIPFSADGGVDMNSGVSFDLYAVKENGNWGFRNTKGELVVPCLYQPGNSLLIAPHFDEDGYADVKRDGKKGIIDTKGNEVVPCEYDDFSYSFSFYGNMMWVIRDGKYGVYDIAARKELVPCIYDMVNIEREYQRVLVKQDGKVGCLNWEGEWVFPCIYEYDNNWLSFSDGLVRVKKDKKWGYVNTEGEVVIPFQYNNAFNFYGGLAQVKKYIGNDYCEGVINTEGKEIVPLGKYDTVAVRKIGEQVFIRVRKSEKVDKKWQYKYGFLDEQGNEVLPCVYDDITCGVGNGGKLIPTFDTEEGGLYKVERDGKVCYLGFVDGKFTEAISPDYDEVASEVSDGLLWAYKDGKGGYMNTEGEEVIPFIYDYVDDFHDGLAWVLRDGKWFYINTQGQEMRGCMYDYVTVNPETGESVLTDFEKDFMVKSDGEMDYVTPYGVAISGKNSCWTVNSNSSNGRTSVTNSVTGKVGFWNSQKQAVIPFEYDALWVSNYDSRVCSFTKDGISRVQKNQKYGYIDHWGKEVVPCVYDTVYDQRIDADGDPTVFAIAKRDGKWYVLKSVAQPTAFVSAQDVLLDGESTYFPCYALKDANGNLTNYVKLRDFASILSGTSAQFNVGWDGAVNIETGKAYAANGSEMTTPYAGNRVYENATSATNIDGVAANLEAIVLKDDAGNGYTYYKLRDLGNALGFTVDWSAEKGIFIETK